AISHDHIPVLFVPGSGGSAKQVRSVASIMMNKTEMTSAPFRMHFYAVDFDEELSFLSGSILNRQRDFVVRAISTIQKMYSHKIVLIGHSLGGTVLHALPAHPRFTISNMGLVIILASPISAPPIVMDEAMISFYESMQKAWASRKDELRHVGLVSYSGGSKDFQVPDHLATIHGTLVCIGAVGKRTPFIFVFLG
ncbi:PGAP1-like protein, partial [Ancylostoma duodenale]